MSTAGLREKEKMHIVENHENLKRMYTQLLSSMEKKEGHSLGQNSDGNHTEQSRDTTEDKKTIRVCKFGRRCYYGLDCKYKHPEINKVQPSAPTFVDSNEAKINEENTRKAKKFSEIEKQTPTLCRNGPTCKYLNKSGYCMFHHPELNRPSKNKQNTETKMSIPCRNGPSCKYLSDYGYCHFSHPDNEKVRRNERRDGANERKSSPLYSERAEEKNQGMQELAEPKNLLEGMQRKLHSLNSTMTNMMAEFAQLKRQNKSRH